MLANISIVIPCFNSGDTIRETLESIRVQSYPSEHLEVIVVDAMSTDSTSQVLSDFTDIISCIIREEDKGQYDAVNKGILRATGDVVAYLNADDVYLPGALNFIGAKFASDPDISFIYGDTINILESGDWIAKPKISFSFNIALQAYLIINQPSSFWRRSLHNKIGYFDIDLDCCADYDFYLRVALHLGDQSMIHVYRYLAGFRVLSTSKTSTMRSVFSRDTRTIRAKYFKKRHYLFRRLYKYFYLFLAEYRFFKERGLLLLRYTLDAK